MAAPSPHTESGRRHEDETSGVSATSGPAADPERSTTQEARSLLLVGGAAVFFPLVYLVSDLLEVAQGDFTTLGLSLTYVGEAGFPLFVVGICAVQRDRMPWWGLLGGIAYAYSYVFFTSTVVWALVASSPTWEVLSSDFGWWMTVHGAVMVAGGIALGLGVVRGGGLPAWTGYTLAAGVALVAAASGLGNLERTVAAAVPDLAFIGIGVSLVSRGLRTSRR